MAEDQNGEATRSITIVEGKGKASISRKRERIVIAVEDITGVMVV